MKVNAASAPTSTIDDLTRLKLAALWVLIGAGLVVRLVILVRSVGSNDIVYWGMFADSIRKVGILQTYRDIVIFNHPPLAGYWAAVTQWLSGTLGIPFAPLFKSAPFVADLATAWLVWRSTRPRGQVRALTLATVFLWSPIAILVSCFHANTDPILASLLLAAALAADAERPFAAGLVLAAALNVKIVAIFAVPVILLRPATWRDRFRICSTAAIAIVPFLPVLLGAGKAFFRNGVAYNSNSDEWGIVYLFRHLGDLHHIGPFFVQALALYQPIGRWLILLVAVAVGIVARGGRQSATQGTTLVLAAFLVLAPGFGLQYTAWVLPLLFLVAPLRTAVAYSLMGGAFLLLTYVHFWQGTMPPMSWFISVYPPGAAIFGFAAWLIMAGYLARGLWAWRPGAGPRTRLAPPRVGA